MSRARALVLCWFVFFSASVHARCPEYAEPSVRLAHYMVCCVANRERTVDAAALFLKEVAAAQRNCLTGFVLNVGDWLGEGGRYRDVVRSFYRALDDTGSDFKLMLSLDQAAVHQVDQILADLAGFRANLRVKGRIAVTTFGLGPDKAAGIASLVAAKKKYGLFVLPGAYPVGGESGLTDRAAMSDLIYALREFDGFSLFAAALRIGEIKEAVGVLDSLLRAEDVLLVGVSPFYRSHPKRSFRYLSGDGFSRLIEGLRATKARAGSWLQLLTWNDWAESTYLAPKDFSDMANDAWGAHWGAYLSDHSGYLGVAALEFGKDSADRSTNEVMVAYMPKSPCPVSEVGRMKVLEAECPDHIDLYFHSRLGGLVRFTTGEGAEVRVFLPGSNRLRFEAKTHGFAVELLRGADVMCGYESASEIMVNSSLLEYNSVATKFKCAGL